ncbi:MAG: ABC transporter ATP-binding protein [Dehalococcoidia bacterium]
MNEKKYQNEPLISLRGLTKNYQEGDRTRKVLGQLDADFGRGERVALLGRSGTGKSTLLNLISGIDVPTSGDIRIDGHDITRLSERDRTLFRRKNIGFIYQFFNLIPTLTVIENVLLPLQLNNQKDTEKAFSLLEEVGLQDRLETYPDRLSGGEQQRVAMVRALVHEPLLILADEPTGNVDAETSRQILGIMDGLIRKEGKTLIIVTHSPEAAAIADRVLTLKEGRLTEGGNGAAR